jgi:predicted ester cyclase
MAFAIQLQVDALIAEGNFVAARYTERGTFRAAFHGRSPTGKSYELVAMEWFELRDGKIRRRWGARDSAAQARQIGLKGQ